MSNQYVTKIIVHSDLILPQSQPSTLIDTSFIEKIIIQDELCNPSIQSAIQKLRNYLNITVDEKAIKLIHKYYFADDISNYECSKYLQSISINKNMINKVISYTILIFDCIEPAYMGEMSNNLNVLDSLIPTFVYIDERVHIFNELARCFFPTIKLIYSSQEFINDVIILIDQENPDLNITSVIVFNNLYYKNAILSDRNTIIHYIENLLYECISILEVINSYTIYDFTKEWFDRILPKSNFLVYNNKDLFLLDLNKIENQYPTTKGIVVKNYSNINKYMLCKYFNHLIYNYESKIVDKNYINIKVTNENIGKIKSFIALNLAMILNHDLNGNEFKCCTNSLQGGYYNLYLKMKHKYLKTSANII
jgi:hypothetical protein